jgi:hypothetical protein
LSTEQFDAIADILDTIGEQTLKTNKRIDEMMELINTPQVEEIDPIA